MSLVISPEAFMMASTSATFRSSASRRRSMSCFTAVGSRPESAQDGADDDDVIVDEDDLTFVKIHNSDFLTDSTSPSLFQLLHDF